MDQKALDDAYDQDVYAPNRPLIVARRIAASERTRAILGPPQRVAYGPSEYEGLDIFRATPSPASGGGKGGGAPINVFVHGGAWRRNKAADYALQAEPLVHAGAHAVIIDFINVEQAGGDLFPMYEQVRRALAWIWRNAESFGGDRERFYISAHSSGSHLAACFLTDGWREEDLPKNFCKGALLLSGMYELEPVRRSKRSSYVKFTDAMVEKLSSQRRLDGLHTPLVLAYGTCETPEFQRQTQDFFAAVAAAGKSAELIVGEAYNHFELLETLANPYGLTGRAMLRQMKLA
jgi:arylformamidase